MLPSISNPVANTSTSSGISSWPHSLHLHLTQLTYKDAYCHFVTVVISGRALSVRMPVVVTDWIGSVTRVQVGFSLKTGR